MRMKSEPDEFQKMVEKEFIVIEKRLSEILLEDKNPSAEKGTATVGALTCCLARYMWWLGLSEESFRISLDRAKEQLRGKFEEWSEEADQ